MNWSNVRWRSTTSRYMRCGSGADAVESDPIQFKWDLAAEQRARRKSLGRGAAVGVPVRHLSTLLPASTIYMDRVLNKLGLSDSEVLPHTRHPQSHHRCGAWASCAWENYRDSRYRCRSETMQGRFGRIWPRLSSSSPATHMMSRRMVSRGCWCRTNRAGATTSPTRP